MAPFLSHSVSTLSSSESSSCELPLEEQQQQQRRPAAQEERHPQDNQRRQRQRQRKVSWDAVHVHEHEIILGDNPSVSNGLPVALGPRRLSFETMHVNDYEEDFRRNHASCQIGTKYWTKDERAQLIRESLSSSSFSWPLALMAARFKTKRQVKSIQKSRKQNMSVWLQEEGKKEGLVSSSSFGTRRVSPV